jgi:hypothetical protein
VLACAVAIRGGGGSYPLGAAISGHHSAIRAIGFEKSHQFAQAAQKFLASVRDVETR